MKSRGMRDPTSKLCLEGNTNRSSSILHHQSSILHPPPSIFNPPPSIFPFYFLHLYQFNDNFVAMMKKLLVSLLSALLCISVVAEPETQSDGNQNMNNITIDENGNVFVSPLKYHISSDTTAEVIFDRSYIDLESVVIPSEIRIAGYVYPVTSIEYRAFYGCYDMTNIEIPSSVTHFDISAFDYCTELTSINVSRDNPNYSSEDGILYDKNKTTLVLVPEGKEGSIVLLSGVTCIGDNACSGCRNLTSIEIPKSVTSIGKNAFWGCHGLTSIEIPSSVTSIGDNAFSGCHVLTSIKVSKDNPNYSSENGVLYDKNKTNLICVPSDKKGIFEIPSSVTNIGVSAFDGCSGLTSIKIPNSVASIGKNAFWGCHGLTSIKIPKSVTCIGEDAFMFCHGLTSIEIPSGVTSIGDWTFYDCQGLTSIKIPLGVTSIGCGAFEGSSLTNINIPSSVTNIGNYAFMFCHGLTSIKIPKNVTIIGESAFMWCSGLRIVKISSSVTSIGEDAFYGCGNLDIIIDNSEKNVSVGKDAFEGCKSVKFLK